MACRLNVYQIKLRSKTSLFKALGHLRKLSFDGMNEPQELALQVDQNERIYSSFTFLCILIIPILGDLVINL